ncbi:ultraviolet-B receptor UVR8-like isoform X1 [Glycine soja]|uniref:ultraviolet-B receptor UVR8-like isoform X1 n=1 Tax=Glycine soja TaxID=3848 RepID=UPI00103EE627|nr:ultraviolet-B receptor UVR8-like isoform X1 [Glycine soja]
MNETEAVEDAREVVVVKEEERAEKMVYMWGYLPGASPKKSPILSPAPVTLSDPSLAVDSWKDVCGGGCGFAMVISEKGKLITWGSADDEGQSYLISGKHGEIPGLYQLPTEASVVKAAAGWAHCASVTEEGEVYAWGWKECVPSGKVITDFITVGSLQKDIAGKQSSSIAEQRSPQSSNTSSGSDSHHDNKKVGDEVVKRRKITFSRQDSDSQASGDEFFSVSPSLVTLGNGVKITSVALGGRHTLALSDVGQVWGWGYGGEGQLGLGSRVKMVSSPHLIPCIESAGKDKSSAFHQGSGAGAQGSNVTGSYVMDISCGGRHSVVITDAGALLTFGWGLYGQEEINKLASHIS